MESRKITLIPCCLCVMLEHNFQPPQMIISKHRWPNDRKKYFKTQEITQLAQTSH